MTVVQPEPSSSASATEFFQVINGNQAVPAAEEPEALQSAGKPDSHRLGDRRLHLFSKRWAAVFRVQSKGCTAATDAGVSPSETTVSALRGFILRTARGIRRLFRKHRAKGSKSGKRRFHWRHKKKEKKCTGETERPTTAATACPPESADGAKFFDAPEGPVEAEPVRSTSTETSGATKDEEKKENDYDDVISLWRLVETENYEVTRGNAEKMDKYKAENEELKNTVEKLKKQIMMALVEEREKAKQSDASWAEVVRSKDREISEVNKKCQAQEKSAKEALKKAEEENARVREKYSTANRELTQKCNGLLSNRDSQIETLTEDWEEAQNEMAEMRKKLVKTEGKLCEAEKKLGETKQELMVTKKKLVEAKKVAVAPAPPTPAHQIKVPLKVRAKMAMMEKTNKELAQKIRDLEEAAKKMVVPVREITVVDTEMANKVADLERDNSELREWTRQLGEAAKRLVAEKRELALRLEAELQVSQLLQNEVVAKENALREAQQVAQNAAELLRYTNSQDAVHLIVQLLDEKQDLTKEVHNLVKEVEYRKAENREMEKFARQGIEKFREYVEQQERARKEAPPKKKEAKKWVSSQVEELPPEAESSEDANERPLSKALVLCGSANSGGFSNKENEPPAEKKKVAHKKGLREAQSEGHKKASCATAGDNETTAPYNKGRCGGEEGRAGRVRECCGDTLRPFKLPRGSASSSATRGTSQGDQPLSSKAAHAMANGWKAAQQGFADLNRSMPDPSRLRNWF